MNKLPYILKNIFKKRFLIISYIVLIAFAVVFVVQQQLRFDNIASNNVNEPYVDRSMYHIDVHVKYPDGRREWLYSGLRLCHLMTEMKTPENVSFSTWVRWEEFFQDGKIVEIPYRATDGRYWQMMRFDFTEGRPYTQEEVDDNKPLVVLSETSRKRFFGDERQVVGRQVEIQKRNLTVCGVVKDVPYSSPYAFGEYWMPYTAWMESNHNILGLFIVQVLAEKRSDFDAIHKEYLQLIDQLNKEIASEMEIGWTAFGTRAFNHYGKNRTSENYQLSAGDVWRNYLSTLWILLVPLLALICLNFARVNDHSTEIGIRRMVGAGKTEINSELIIESTIIIFIGILLGTFLGYLSVYLFPVAFIGIDTRDFNGGVSLSFTLNIFLHLFLTLVVFLAASTALPMVRSGRQSILKLLKGDEL